MATIPTSTTGKRKSSPTKRVNICSEKRDVKITCECVDENEVPTVNVGSNNDAIATAPKLLQELDQNTQVMQSRTNLTKKPTESPGKAKESPMRKTSETKVSTSSSTKDLIKAKKIKRPKQQQKELEPHEQIRVKWQMRISAASTRMTRSATTGATTEQHKQQ